MCSADRRSKSRRKRTYHGKNVKWIYLLLVTQLRYPAQVQKATTSTEISSSTSTKEKSTSAKKIRRDIRSNKDV